MPDAYTKPDDVISPQNHWTLIGVLRDGGAGEASYAVGMWDGDVRIACRWNGYDGSPIGNPQSRGLPTWMILEPDANAGVVHALGLTTALLELTVELFTNRDQ